MSLLPKTLYSSSVQAKRKKDTENYVFNQKYLTEGGISDKHDGLIINLPKIFDSQPWKKIAHKASKSTLYKYQHDNTSQWILL